MTEGDGSEEINQRIQTRRKPRQRKPVMSKEPVEPETTPPEEPAKIEEPVPTEPVPTFEQMQETEGLKSTENETAGPFTGTERGTSSEPVEDILSRQPDLTEKEKAEPPQAVPLSADEQTEPSGRKAAKAKKEKKPKKEKKKKAEESPGADTSLPAVASTSVPETAKKPKGISIFRFTKKNESIRRAKEEIEQNQRRLFGGARPDPVSIQRMTRPLSARTTIVQNVSSVPKVSGHMKVALALFRDYYTLRPINPKLEESLRKSKMPYSPVQYMSMVTLFALLFGFIGMIALGVAYYFIGTLALFGVPVVVIGALIVYLLGTSIPSSAINKRRKNIDTRLPMALAYIATMASAEVPVETIMYELGKSPQYGEIAKEARAISASSRLFGNDIVTALREEAKYSPSLKFAEFLSGITATVTSGGNLKDYFTMKAKQFQSELSTLIKQNSESVGVLAESYVTVGVAFPLMMIVILGVLAALSSSSGGVITVLYLIVLMMVPMITFVFAFLIQSTIKEVNI